MSCIILILILTPPPPLNIQYLTYLIIEHNMYVFCHVQLQYRCTCLHDTDSQKHSVCFKHIHSQYKSMMVSRAFHIFTFSSSKRSRGKIPCFDFWLNKFYFIFASLSIHEVNSINNARNNVTIFLNVNFIFIFP